MAEEVVVETTDVVEPAPEAVIPEVVESAPDSVTESNLSTEETPVAEIASNEPITEDIVIEGMKYNGVEINVNLNQDIVNTLSDKGIDAKAVTEELYNSEDFTLTEETKEKLYAEFPKWQVDSYLSGVKANNDLFASKHKAEVESAEVAGTAAWEATIEIMGGEDRWDDMSSFALENLSEEDFNDFNDVMQSGSLRVQQVLIKDLYNKFVEAGKPIAPTILDLETGENNGDLSNSGEALTYNDYHKLIKSDEYKKDPTKYDNLRRLGQKQGI